MIKDIPVAVNFNKGIADVIGALKIDESKLPPGVDFHFEPGFIVKQKKGDNYIDVELVELSLIFNKKER